MTLVFVYGTLKGMKRRFGSGSNLQDSEFLGHGITVDDFNLIDGIFPIAIHADNIKAKPEYNGKIFGEVYAVQSTAVTALDAYEGYPDLYTRAMYKVKLLKGGTVEAWIYTGRSINASIGHDNRVHIHPDHDKQLYWQFIDELPLTSKAM